MIQTGNPGSLKCLLTNDPTQDGSCFRTEDISADGHISRDENLLRSAERAELEKERTVFKKEAISKTIVV